MCRMRSGAPGAATERSPGSGTPAGRHALRDLDVPERLALTRACPAGPLRHASDALLEAHGRGAAEQLVRARVAGVRILYLVALLEVADVRLHPERARHHLRELVHGVRRI